MHDRDPYQAGMFKKNPYAKKREVRGEIVVVLDGKLEERKLKLITSISRCVCAQEIHELIITDEPAAPGMQVDRIAYLGFAEVSQGGVIVAGDLILIGDSQIGTVAGFDETHMPNHLNIVIRAEKRRTGSELGVELAMPLICRQA